MEEDIVAFTHDNGGQPFRVNIAGGWFRVYVRRELSEALSETAADESLSEHSLNAIDEHSPNDSAFGRDRNSEIYEDEQFHDLPAYEVGPIVRAWVGEDPRRRGVADSDSWGNTVLAHLGGTRYVIAGSTVSEFSIPEGEVITEFASPLYGSDVSYPYAYSANYVYIIEELDERVTAIPRSHADAELGEANSDPWDILHSEPGRLILRMDERVPRQ